MIKKEEFIQAYQRVTNGATADQFYIDTLMADLLTLFEAYEAEREYSGRITNRMTALRERARSTRVLLANRRDNIQQFLAFTVALPKDQVEQAIADIERAEDGLSAILAMTVEASNHE